MEPPIRSGIVWIDALFDGCVRILMGLADFFGMSYNEINIWIFCVIWPLFTLALMVTVVCQWRSLRRWKRSGSHGRRDDPWETSAASPRPSNNPNPNPGIRGISSAE